MLLTRDPPGQVTAPPPPLPPPGPGRPAARAAAQAGGADPAGVDALLPRPGRGFLLPFLLAALRPGARRWLGVERIAALARLLGLREQAVSQMLDASPGLPEALREGGPWAGRRVPMLGAAEGLSWIGLHWRADLAAPGTGQRPPQPGNGAFAARLELPGIGMVEIRGRMEGNRLDAVAEVQAHLRKATMADMEEAFAATLSRLDLTGKLTVSSGRKHFRT